MKKKNYQRYNNINSPNLVKINIILNTQETQWTPRRTNTKIIIHGCITIKLLKTKQKDNFNNRQQIMTYYINGNSDNNGKF